jgi:hypothetical protein
MGQLDATTVQPEVITTMYPRRVRATRRVRKIAEVETLEGRELLSLVAFNPPDLKPYITLAHEGKNTAPAMIHAMVSSLQRQLTSGPLADLYSGTLVSEAQSLVASYQQNADLQLASSFPNVDKLVKLQGQRIVADLFSLNQQGMKGLIDISGLNTQAARAISALCGGPLRPLNTPLSAYASTTRNFETHLNALAASLQPGASPLLAPSDVVTTLTTEAEAYRNDMHMALQVTHPITSNKVDTAVNNLEAAGATMATVATDAEAETILTNAITAFDTAMLDKTGLFGPRGPTRLTTSELGYLPNNLLVSQATTSIGSVTGSQAYNGTATLTAALTSSKTGQVLSGKPVVFTIDGEFAGTAVTDSSGVATLAHVENLGSTGMSFTVVASFAGDFGNTPGIDSGQFTMTQAPISLDGVSGTATFGGTATLKASLTLSLSHQWLPGETVSFHLDGIPVGSATTDERGVATLTGVATIDSVGTHPGAVAASYAGDSDHQAAFATGDLVVS